MKPFFLSLIVSSGLCFLLWSHWKSAAEERQITAAPPRATVVAKPLRSALTPLDPVRSAKKAWGEFTSRETQDEKISAADWALLDALSLEQIAEWGKKLKPDYYDRRWQAVMMHWASLDGSAAMEHARTYRRSHGSIRGQMLACWIRNDLAGASAEIAEMGVGGDHEPAFNTLAQMDLSMALDVIYRNLESAKNENARLSRNNWPGYQLAAQMGDPARAPEFRSWLEQQSDLNITARMFAMVYSQMKHEGAWLRPERLPDYLPGKDQLPQTLEHPDTVWAMGAIAAGENPLRAVVEKEDALYPPRTDAPPKHSIITRLRAWSSRDPESAGMWLVAQEPWPDRDGAIQGYASTLLRIDPAAATKWAGEMSDPGGRVQTADRSYPRWHRRDPVAAEAWLDTANLSEIHKDYIRGGAKVGR